MSSSSGNPEGAHLPAQGLLVLPKGAFPVTTSSGSRTELTQFYFKAMAHSGSMSP